MIKTTGRIVEKAEQPNGDATLIIEMENGSRVSHELSRDFARGGFHAGEEVTFSISQSASQKPKAHQAQPVEPSEESNSLMNADTSISEDGGSKSKNSDKPSTDDEAVAGTLGGASAESSAFSANKTTKSK